MKVTLPKWNVAAKVNNFLGLIPESPQILDLRKPEEVIKVVRTVKPTSISFSKTVTDNNKNLASPAQKITIKHIE